MTVVYPRLKQATAGGFNDLDSETVVFAAVVEPELLAYSSDSTFHVDVVVCKSFALSSK